MTRFDLHPEELLERASRGALSPADHDRLDQHLAECPVCRVERALGAQAALDAEPLRDEKLMVARLKRDVAQRLKTAPQRRPYRKGVLMAVVLAAGSLASVAAAATLVVMHRSAMSQAVAAPTLAPLEAKSHAAARVAEVAPPAVVEPTPAPADVPPPTVDPTPRLAPVETSSAAEVFGRANLARRDGKVTEAVRLYRALQERFAGSSEELVSRVALGRLLLDRLGDFRGALVQFNSYLASPGSGALREEAMVGRALSLGRLGRSAEERAAWKALLEAWPKSTHAKRAQARLAELDGQPSPGRH